MIETIRTRLELWNSETQFAALSSAFSPNSLAVDANYQLAKLLTTSNKCRNHKDFSSKRTWLTSLRTRTPMRRVGLLLKTKKRTGEWWILSYYVIFTCRFIPNGSKWSCLQPLQRTWLPNLQVIYELKHFFRQHNVMDLPVSAQTTSVLDTQQKIREDGKVHRLHTVILLSLAMWTKGTNLA